jgi:hypothetical protein
LRHRPGHGQLLIVINADFDRWSSSILGMNTPNRAILIGGVVAAAVIAGVVTLLLYEKQDYRDCVAQMWDRKHPAEVRQRQSDADFRECEAYRLREGANCDCKVAFGQPKFCSTHSRIERQVLEDSAGADLIPDPPGTHHPCDSLSLEELRRADADVSSDKPPR